MAAEARAKVEEARAKLEAARDSARSRWQGAGLLAGRFASGEPSAALCFDLGAAVLDTRSKISYPGVRYWDKVEPLMSL